MTRAFLVIALGVVLPLLLCCERDSGADRRRAQPAAHASRRAPADRLLPGESPGEPERVWGFAIPRGMRLEAQFPDAAHIGGTISLEALTKYVGERVAADHVEVTPSHAVFPRARILGGATDHVYKIEISSRRMRTRLVIHDITPPPTVEGLSEAERWQRLGLAPNGQPLNPKALR